VKIFRRHTDHGEIQTVEPDAASDDGWIGGELVLPEIVSQHHHGVSAGSLILLWPESTPELRLRLRYAEEVPAYQVSILHLRLRTGIFGEAEGRQRIGN
jgi:hypothetical protein